jgi:acyl carrier protein
MQALYAGLADIFEVDPAEITGTTPLSDYQWDSLAIVSTIALVDEICGTLLDGKSLTDCVLVGDIESLIAKGGGA